MLREQKENILQMRADGQGYAKIAEALVLPVNTVKSYCRRNGRRLQTLRAADLRREEKQTEEVLLRRVQDGMVDGT